MPRGAERVLRRVFDAMVRPEGKGPKVDDESVTKFLDSVPSDLEGSEADRLIKGLQSFEGETLDEILQHLQSAVKGMRESKDEPTESKEQGKAPTVEKELAPAPKPTSEEKPVTPKVPLIEVVRKIVEFLKTALIISPSKTQRATGVRGKNAHQSNKLREAHRGDSSGGRSYDQGPHRLSSRFMVASRRTGKLS